jgi:hypothetical protein
VLVGRAWAAGAGPGGQAVTIDVDSSIVETYGLDKQGGAKFTYNHVRGYHPLFSVIAGTGDVVHCRLRGGNAHSGRGAASFLCETFGRVRAAGATGPLVLRADSGFYSHQVVDACGKAGVAFSVTAKLYKGLHSPRRRHRRGGVDPDPVLRRRRGCGRDRIPALRGQGKAVPADRAAHHTRPPARSWPCSPTTPTTP